MPLDWEAGRGGSDGGQGQDGVGATRRDEWCEGVMSGKDIAPRIRRRDTNGDLKFGQGGGMGGRGEDTATTDSTF